MTDHDPTQRYESPVSGEIPATTRPGRSRARWLVAAVLTLLVVGTAAGAALMLTADGGDPDVLAWTPADSVLYAEARLDLPGDQKAELAKAMTAFPGFDDQAAFPVKLGEALDALLGRASEGKTTYQADIEPWFGGQVGVSIGAIPASGEASDARGLVLVSVRDAAMAGAWAARVLSEAGATTATQTHAGVTLTTISPPSGRAVPAGMEAAWAILGPVMALGDTASVKAAIDTRGSAGLPTVAQFRTARTALPGDHLGFAYLDPAAILDGGRALTGAAAEALPSLPAFLDTLQVDWVAAAVRAEGGAFVVDTAMPHVTALGPARSAESRLPALLPPTTVALIGGHDVGATLLKARDLIASDPSLTDGVKQVEDVLALVGGADGVAGWMGEVGIAITIDGDEVGGGLVVTSLDAVAPERLFTQLRGLLALAGGPSGLKVTEESHAGATIVVIDLGNLGDLAGMATDGAIEAPANLRIAYALTDEVVVLGYGTEFVKAVLDARTGDTLAGSERFASALKLVDRAHGSLVWLDLAAARGMVEPQIPADEKDAYQTEIKPYLDAFDSIIGVNLPGETVDRSTLILRVSGD